MGTNIWRGHAPAIAQVDTVTAALTWANTDTATATINDKDVVYTVAGISGNTHLNVLTGLAAALNASTITEFAEATYTVATNTTMTATADSAGMPFSMTVAASTGGDGTLATAATTGNAGPADASTAANWSEASVPGASDLVVFENSDRDCKYGLDFGATNFASLGIPKTFTGDIGLPRTHGSGTSAYVEYRNQDLKFQCDNAVDVGRGTGSGSRRVRLDTVSVDTTINVFDTGSEVETGIPALLLTNTSAATTVNIMKGSVGHCFFSGETGTIHTLNVSYRTNKAGDAFLWCGNGSTLNTVNISGGTTRVASNIVTLIVNDGVVSVDEAATITTLTIDGGTVVDKSTGTFTTVSLVGEYDHRQSLEAKTITNLTTFSKAKYHDPFGVVTVTNGIDFSKCSPDDLAVFDTAPNKTWTQTAI